MTAAEPAGHSRSRANAGAKPRRRSASTRGDLRQVLQRTFGHARLRPGQLEVIERVLAGRSVFALMPTGAGKSLCWQLPAALGDGGLTLVVSPLIALMQDQCEKLDELGIRGAALNSALDAADSAAALRALRDGTARVLFTTPERLAGDALLADTLAARGVALFVLDEAHCLSQWGHDFRPAYLELGRARRALGAPPLLALSATASAEVIDDVRRHFGLDALEVVHTGVYRANLHYAVEAFEDDAARAERLLGIVRATPGPGIVYAATVKMATAVQGALAGAGESAALYHARLGAALRREAQERFMSGERRVMVATNAFGLGIDKPDTRFVIHCQMPASLDVYYQESGRAGRDGRPAACTLLYQPRDRAVQQFFMTGRYPRLADLQALCDALEQVPDEGAWTLAALQRALPGLARSKLQVALALLRDERVVAMNRRRELALTRRAVGDASLERMLQVYADKAESDRESLERMVYYARCGRCRWRVLLEHFDEPAEFERCGSCDICLRHAALEQEAMAPRPAAAEVAPGPPESSAGAAFAIGQAVRVPRFGAGRVAACDAQTVAIDFAGGRRRSFMSAYVEPLDAAAPPPQHQAIVVAPEPVPAGG
jgi:ATP-dependent DNA helicase RecQ